MTQKRKSKRLGIAKLKVMTKVLIFQVAIPNLKEELISQLIQAKKMYHAMSLQTKLFLIFS
ncbi:hypothetical protein ACEW7V_02735 [Areca yellow leaf disease phytoplasma]|uniref:hypothetical protein n=1 Tax=Areca yellow leaf disease phytoplasma TaxID=927614 RepID=UPI0035B565BA